MNPFLGNTDQQIEALRATDRYLVAILVRRLTQLPLFGCLAGVAMVSDFVDGDLEFAVLPYAAGAVALAAIAIFVVDGWAGIPAASLDMRLRMIMLVDALRLDWWSGPPPRRYPS